MSRLAQLQKLFAADPSDADVMYMLAQEHAKAGDHGAAVEWYDRCLSANPDYHYAYFHKAKSLESSGDAPAAAAVLRAGVQRAARSGNAKAQGELAGYLDELEG